MSASVIREDDPGGRRRIVIFTTPDPSSRWR
jgi:hypothetical protein